MAFLIVVPIHYLAYVFWGSIMTFTRTDIIVGSGVGQIYTGGHDIGYCTTWPSFTTITLVSTMVPAGKLSVCFGQNDRLIVSRLSFVFFFRRLKSFFFFIGLLAFLITKIHFPNIGRRLKCSLEFGFNGLIKHFVSEV